MVRSRHELIGELAHLSVPDLKEAEGGLRDATMLKVAGRDVAGRRTGHRSSRARASRCWTCATCCMPSPAGPTDRIAPEMWSELAAALETGEGEPGERAAQVHVRELGRRITHLSRLTWRRVDDVLHQARVAEDRAKSVARAAGWRVLPRPGARWCSTGPRAPQTTRCCCCARRPRPRSRTPCSRPRPRRDWCASARRCPTRGRPRRRLPAGAAARLRTRVCSACGRPSRRPAPSTGFLPEWERIRLLPHASVIHRFTVDRHVIETCMEASTLIRSVARPDVLMVAALLHDIGKGSLTEHSVAGEPVARTIATRMGFEAGSVDLIALLVRWHLLLAETATTRDPDDPATVDVVTSKLGTAEALSLLAALTEADAKATSPKAWSSWRSGPTAISGAGPMPPSTVGPRCRRSSRTTSRSRRICAATRCRSRWSRCPTARESPRSPSTGRSAGRLRGHVRAQPQPRPRRPGCGRRASLASRSGRSPMSTSTPRSCAPSTTPWSADGSTRTTGSGRMPAGGLAPTVVVRPEASDQATVLDDEGAVRDDVAMLPITVAALMTTEWIAKHLDGARRHGPRAHPGALRGRDRIDRRSLRRARGEGAEGSPRDPRILRPGRRARGVRRVGHRDHRRDQQRAASVARGDHARGAALSRLGRRLHRHRLHAGARLPRARRRRARARRGRHAREHRHLQRGRDSHRGGRGRDARAQHQRQQPRRRARARGTRRARRRAPRLRRAARHHRADARAAHGAWRFRS